MELSHEEHDVDIFDTEGQIIGQKKRADIDKVADIVHGIYIFVFTPEKELWISDLSASTQHGGQFGCTAAGIARHGESALTAAERTLAYELGVTTYMVNILGTEVATLADNTTRLMTVATLVYNGPVENRDGTVTSMKRVDRSNLEQLINDRFLFAPTFLWAWEKYQSKFLF